MNSIRLLPFLLAALTMSGTVVSGGSPTRATVIRVLDPSGVPYPDAVVLVNPGQTAHSFAVVTDRSGTAILPKLECEVCLVTAMDPRRLFFDKTTEFESGTASVTLTLPGVRPIIDTFADPEAIRVRVQVKGADGAPLAKKAVVVRKRVGTMGDNTFSIVTTDRKGLMNLKLRPGEYVLASLVGGRFLEASLSLAPTVGQKCSEEETDCYIANAVRNPLPAHFTVSLAPPGETP